MMDIEELKALLDKAKERFLAPSYSATLYKDGKYINLTSGYSDLKKKFPTDSDTLYLIASCTKSLTAGTICSLIDQGMLGLDDCIKEYIPEFEMCSSYVSDHLTVRDILCHRSGLPRHDFSWYSRLSSITEEEIVKSLKYLKLNQQLRYKWQYNNHMYVLAGYLIKRITGEKWQDVMRKNIFEPLEINRVAFSPKEAVAMGGCALPYLPNQKTLKPHITPYAEMYGSGAAAGLYMNAESLAKWNAMLLNGGMYKGKQIISEKLSKEMITPQMILQEEIAKPLRGKVHNSCYGLGLGTHIFKGHRVVSHNGHIDGFMSEQFILPDDEIAGVVLTNLGIIPFSTVLRLIISEHCIDGDEDWTSLMYDNLKDQIQKKQKTADQLMAQKPENAPCPVELKDICGHYSNPGYGDAEITQEDDNIAIRMGDFKITAVHYANQYFYFEFPHMTPGIKYELCVDIDAQASVTGFHAIFDSDTKERIHFVRKIDT